MRRIPVVGVSVPCVLRATALVLLCAAVPAQADWKRDYALGLRAIEQGDWAEAERHMRAAIAEDAEASERKRFQGVKFDRYVPHWYAGVAAYRQGDCVRAEAAWSDASSKRVVAALDELAAEHARLAGECRQRLAGRSATEDPPATGAAGGSIAAQAPADRREPTTQPQVARTNASSARAGSTSAGSPSAGTANADAASARATSAGAASAGSASAGTARTPPPRAAATPPAQPAQVATRPAPARPSPAPAPLRSALEDYLAGRYAQVAQLDPAAITDARARAQLLLLRAAARFVRAELEGGTEQALEAVRADVLAARSGGGSAADQALYPPRFRALVAATR